MLGVWFLLGFWASRVTARKGRRGGWPLGIFLGPVGVLIAYLLGPRNTTTS